MMKKKKKIIILMAISIIIVFVIVFLCTHSVYWHNKYYEYDRPSQTDAEYLDIWDLRLLVSNKDKNEIDMLGKSIIDESRKSNGIIAENYKDIIPDDVFARINPRSYLAKDRFRILDEKLDFIETDVLQHGDKAIFFYGYKYKANYSDGKEEKEYETGYDGTPNRLYLEYTDGKWRITSCYVLT
ncbi:MAG: hypothetical protein ILA24_07840 [Ruminococcus sp.]|nr:hypothetical protein [Ruminococcus sp.]